MVTFHSRSIQIGFGLLVNEVRHGVNIALSFYKKSIFLNFFSYEIERHFPLVYL